MSNQTPEQPGRGGTPQGWPTFPDAQHPVPHQEQVLPHGQVPPYGQYPQQGQYPAQGPGAQPGSGAYAQPTPSGQDPAWGAGGQPGPTTPGWASPSGAWSPQAAAAGQPGPWSSQPATPYGAQGAWDGQYATPAANQQSWAGAGGGWHQPGAWGTSTAPGTGQQYPAPGSPNNDPRAPIGAPVPAAVGIDQFSQRPSRTPLLVGLAVLLAIVLALVLGTRAINRAQTDSTPTPSASATGTRPSASVGNGNTAQFENDRDDTAGTWTIDKYAWSGDQLLITTTVSVTKGTQPMGFFAIANDSETQTYEATASGRPDDLLGKQVEAGQTLSGTVSFTMPRKESTIFITDSNDRQVTALVVPG